MNQKLLFPVVTLALGAAGGFFVGKGGKSEVTAAGTETASISRSSRSPSEMKVESRSSSSRGGSASEIFKMPGQTQRMQALLDYYSGLSPEQLAEEAKKLDSIDMPERIMASYILFGKWAETDPMSAMAFSDKMGFTGMFVKPTIMQSWASVDPTNAAKYYSENPGQFAMMGMFGGRGGSGGGPMGNGAASIIAGEWASQDPTAAMAWAKTLNGSEKGNAMSSIVSKVSQTDPDKAIALAATMEGEEKTRANRQIAESLGSKDWDKAQQFIAGLPVDEQDDARRRAFDGLAKENPQKAIEQLSSFTDPEQKNRATATVAEELSKENPGQAFELVISSPEEAQGDAMRSVMMNYARQDSSAALASIEKLPEGETRDRAVGTYVFATPSTNYAETFTLAESIKDEGDRQRAIGVSAAKWMTTDPDAAKAAVQQSTALSDDVKKRISEGGDFMRSMRDGGGFRGNRGGGEGGGAAGGAGGAPAAGGQ